MKKCWLLSLLWMMCSVALAQGEYHFSWLDVKTGLADNHVRCITRDSYGFIWVGTINGLSRFDGHNAKSYSLTSNPKIPPAPLRGEPRIGRKKPPLKSAKNVTAGRILTKYVESYQIENLPHRQHHTRRRLHDGTRHDFRHDPEKYHGAQRPAQVDVRQEHLQYL